MMQSKTSIRAFVNVMPATGWVKSGLSAVAALMPAMPPTLSYMSGKTMQTLTIMKKKKLMSVTATPISPPRQVRAIVRTTTKMPR